MIHIEEPPAYTDEDVYPMVDYLKDLKSLKAKIETAIEVVKCMPIDGCITGSCWLPGFDPDLWGSTPDIDVFVYSEDDLTRAIDYSIYQLKMRPGIGTERSEMQERWKIRKLFEDGLNYKIGISTYKFYSEGIVINYTFKQRKMKNRWIPITDACAVLRSFDMTIVCQAYDIKTHIMHDMRPDNYPVTEAHPNPLRKQDCMMWTVAKWVRQFDRVVKYYNRGYDTRPMARFYLQMIDECIEAGCLFDSEESHGAFTTFSEEFIEKRAVIAEWLKAHEED